MKSGCEHFCFILWHLQGRTRCTCTSNIDRRGIHSHLSAAGQEQALGGCWEWRGARPPREIEGTEATGKHQAEAARDVEVANCCRRRLEEIEGRSRNRGVASIHRIAFIVLCFVFSSLFIDCSRPWSVSCSLPALLPLVAAATVLFARISARFEDGRNKQRSKKKTSLTCTTSKCDGWSSLNNSQPLFEVGG